MANLKIVVMTSARDLECVEAQWRELESNSPGFSLFQSPDWIIPWWNSFGNNAKLYCIGVQNSESLVGLACLVVCYRTASKELRFAGDPLSDYNSFLTSERSPSGSEISKAIWMHIVRERRQWDVLSLTEVPDISKILGYRIGSGLAKDGLLMLRTAFNPGANLILPETWGEYLDSLDGPRRKSVLYRMRLMERETDATYESREGENLEHDDLRRFEIQRRIWLRTRGRYNQLSKITRTDQYVRFLESMGQRMLRRRALRLESLNVGGQAIAQQLVLLQDRNVFVYSKSFDPTFAKLSPGLVLDLCSIRDSIDRGASTYDLGRGDEPYKYYLGARPTITENWVGLQKSARSLFGYGFQALGNAGTSARGVANSWLRLRHLAQ